MVYQGEKYYKTDMHVSVTVPYFGGGVGSFDSGTTKVFYCHILELDDTRIVQDYDVIARPAGGVPKKG